MARRYCLQEGQRVGVVADHFPLAVFLAEYIGRPQRDLLGLAVDEVLSDFVALDGGEVLADRQVDPLGSDLAAELQGRLALPIADT